MVAPGMAAKYATLIFEIILNDGFVCVFFESFRKWTFGGSAKFLFRWHLISCCGLIILHTLWLHTYWYLCILNVTISHFMCPIIGVDGEIFRGLSEINYALLCSHICDLHWWIVSAHYGWLVWIPLKIEIC